MNSLTGKLIVIEGLEGAGKSTAVDTVLNFLAAQQIKTITTREPGGTTIGEQLRTIIKNPEYKESMDDKCELLLLYAARIQLLEEVIKPALNQGCWVVADRFELSTKAYQGGGRGINLDLIEQLSAFCLQGFKPHLTLYLDIHPEIGMQRARSRGAFDRIEQQSIDFFHRVHTTYNKYVAADDKAVVIDATDSMAEVQSAIQTALAKFVESSQ